MLTFNEIIWKLVKCVAEAVTPVHSHLPSILKEEWSPSSLVGQSNSPLKDQMTPVTQREQSSLPSNS